METYEYTNDYNTLEPIGCEDIADFGIRMTYMFDEIMHDVVECNKKNIEELIGKKIANIETIDDDIGGVLVYAEDYEQTLEHCMEFRLYFEECDATGLCFTIDDFSFSADCDWSNKRLADYTTKLLNYAARMFLSKLETADRLNLFNSSPLKMKMCIQKASYKNRSPISKNDIEFLNKAIERYCDDKEKLMNVIECCKRGYFDLEILKGTKYYKKAQKIMMMM